MKYLTLSTFDLNRIDFKNFTFPKLVHSRYQSTNGWNERETIEHVWADDDEKSNLFYTSSYFAYSGDLAEEVRIFNTNPKKYWTELLVPVLEEHAAFEEYLIEDHKKELKRTNKFLQKLKG
jgi:hypothetical protein